MGVRIWTQFHFLRVAEKFEILTFEEMGVYAPKFTEAITMMKDSPTKEICYCSALRRATRAATRLYDGWMKDSGLKVTQYSLLAKIDRAGSIRVTDLARRMEMERTAMGRNLSLLERRGLIRSEGDGVDLRNRLYLLTESGIACLAAARPFWNRAQAEMRRRLKRREFAALDGVVEAIVGTED